MSAIICFDIRNFSTHVSHLRSVRKTDMIFNVIINIFRSLDVSIKKSRQLLDINGPTFINHTGDGFVAIFNGKGNSLQSLLVASLLSLEVGKLLKSYNLKVLNKVNVKLLPSLDYGIGIHLGRIKEFEYYQKYPENQQVSGFLGDAINISYRVQETTKDHIYQVICTKRLYGDAIKTIKDEHKITIRKYFKELDKHKLRGMSGPYTLYGVDIDLATKIESNMISNQPN